jgi:hypothetical protein
MRKPSESLWKRHVIPRGLGIRLVTASLLVPFGCGGSATGSTRGGGGAAGNTTLDGRSPDGGGAGSSGESLDARGNAGFKLLGAPLPFNPTMHGFGLNVVLADGDPSILRAHARVAGTTIWGNLAMPEVRGSDIAQWILEGLSPGRRYEYEILAASEPNGDAPLYSGAVVTQRQAGESFTFALIADSHIGPHASFSNQGNGDTLAAVSAEVGAVSPDFMVNLGDMISTKSKRAASTVAGRR